MGDDDAAAVEDSEKCAAELMKLETEDAREGRGRAILIVIGGQSTGRKGAKRVQLLFGV